MRRSFITADVFTDQPFGGNPLAVLPDASGLTTDQMQRIAREFNLSETVFVLPPENPANTRRLRIFVPSAEIPFAGHPTIGTAIILAHGGAFALDGDEVSITFEMQAGPVPVKIRLKDGRPVSATLTAPVKPEIRPAPPIETLAALLSVTADELVQTEAASSGVPFTLVEVKDRDVLGRVRIDPAIDRQIGSDAWGRWPYVFTRDAQEGFDFQVRMFAPAEGIPEDPATGAAAAAFAGWLGHHDPMQDGTFRKIIAQGIEMGRPSRIEIEVDKQAGVVTAVRVTGSAVLISEGQITEPPA